MVGATMFILGILRLGSLVSYVSNAVMTGFVMGASALIIVGELGNFSGYEPEGANDLAEVWNWIANIKSMGSEARRRRPERPKQADSTQYGAVLDRQVLD
jgi:MFS superfamily sulfate permease-like transporter